MYREDIRFTCRRLGNNGEVAARCVLEAICGSIRRLIVRLCAVPAVEFNSGHRILTRMSKGED